MWIKNNNYIVRAFEFKRYEKAVEFIYATSSLRISAEHIPFWEDSVHMVIIRLKTDKDTDKVFDKENLLTEKLEEIYSHI